LNPFERLSIPQEGLDAEKRIPFTHSELRTIKAACYEANDDIRHIIAFQLSTGARLGELIGLLKSDVSLDPPVPFIFIRPHERLGHTLKTPGSERRVPLIGSSYFAAQEAVRCSSSQWLFPRYASDGSVRPTHASNTINKYLRETLHIPKTSVGGGQNPRINGAGVKTGTKYAVGSTVANKG
jgi:integrase